MDCSRKNGTAVYNPKQTTSETLMKLTKLLATFALLGAANVFAAPSSPEAVVRANLDAFNRQEVDALVATVADDFVWYNIDGGKMVPETTVRESLRKGMQGYFKSLPSARSAFDSLTVNGAFVSGKERAMWTNKAGESKSQSALAIYEVQVGLIKRVWYFPVQK